MTFPNEYAIRAEAAYRIERMRETWPVRRTRRSRRRRGGETRH